MKKFSVFTLLLIVFFSIFVFDHQTVQAASSPYDVESSVRNGWSDTLGLKNFPQRSSRRLVYDVYSHKYTSDGYRIVSRDFGKGRQQYINFQGWSVLQGYTRHTTNNHETYIVARKVVGLNDLGTTKVYGTLPYGNLSATEDLEYNNQGSGVFNECPSGAMNKDNEMDCNMRYDNVGFNAFVPLNELFPDSNESASWTLFIVKRVGNHVVYSPLNIPFQFSNKAFEKGEISLSSGIDATILQMNMNGVLRRKYPRQLQAEVLEELGSDRHFTQGKYYPQIDSDETETAVWYGVRSSEDRNTKRWANTAYWTFGGKQALLSYRTDYIPPAESSCPKPVTPKDRYEYELDLEITKIDGKTVPKNSITTTEVEVRRVSFASDRDAAKKAINSDISRYEAEKSQLSSELTTLKSQESTIKRNLASAEQTEDYARINQYLRDLQAKRQQISNTECHINTTQQEIDHYKTELSNLKTKETTNHNVASTVLIKFDDIKQDSEKPVELMENETRSLTFQWELSSDGTVTGDINPARNLVSNLSEQTFENNIRSTPIYIASYFSPDACAAPNESSYAEGIVRTINSSSDGQEIFKEKLTTSLEIPVDYRSRRAGLGFEFSVVNEYINEDPESPGSGPVNQMVYMPDMVNHLRFNEGRWQNSNNSLVLSGYEVPLEKVSTIKQQTSEETIWNLPETLVEEFSGSVFSSSNDPNRNLDDLLLDGGRKWYLSFEQPDGQYEFNSLVRDVGINKLNTCATGVIEVDGTIIGDQNNNDDFIKRSVSPSNAFPYGEGWNWSGKDQLITDLNDWYFNWFDQQSELPTDLYEETFILDQSTINDIQIFDKQNPEVKAGNSIFNHIQVPR